MTGGKCIRITDITDRQQKRKHLASVMTTVIRAPLRTSAVYQRLDAGLLSACWSLRFVLVFRLTRGATALISRGRLELLTRILLSSAQEARRQIPLVLSRVHVQVEVCTLMDVFVLEKDKFSESF